MEDDGQATRSASSISSQKSIGPKTAPKPSKAVIERQLSRESLDLTQISTVTSDHNFDHLNGSAQQISSGSPTPSDELLNSGTIEDIVFLDGESK